MMCVFNIPVGVPFYDTYLHDGCVKLNGATVNRADYIRPVKIATDKSLWTSSPSTEPYKYGNGNGSTTMTLPDYRNRVIQGGDMLAILAAGLPNITGEILAMLNTVNDTSVPAGSGALKLTTKERQNSNIVLGDGGDMSCTVTFNASQANNIYGSSTTVQPPAIQLIPQIKY